MGNATDIRAMKLSKETRIEIGCALSMREIELAKMVETAVDDEDRAYWQKALEGIESAKKEWTEAFYA